MNVWCFSGRVGADAELRTTQTGEKVLSFRVANDIGFGDRRTTQWVDCSYWGKRGESIANYVKKGDKVAVSGELKLEEFTRKDGTPGSKLSVRVNDMDLGDKNRGDSEDQQETTQRSQSQARPPDQNQKREGNRSGSAKGGGKPAFDQELDDEIPFLYKEGLCSNEVCDVRKRMSSFSFLA